MTKNFIKRRCENCNNIDLVDTFSFSTVKKIAAIRYIPCKTCGYYEEPLYKKYNNDKRCDSCHIPFSIEKHFCKNLCKRCYNRVIYRKSSPN